MYRKVTLDFVFFCREVTHDYSCFKSPEGFFNTDLWGMDYPCVHKLVFQAIQSCPIDSRKRMYR